MTRQENMQMQEMLCSIYSGIIANNPISDGILEQNVKYKFLCPQFALLKEKYGLEQIAGRGTDFERAKRVLHHFAPRLHHSSYYKNQIECNALALLEYSLDDPDHGINCLNKSKILQECLLALGIYARRVFMMPYSPFDMDNHVVVEMFDTASRKWIMLDPTTDCYMVDQDLKPLSLLELRERFGDHALVAPVEANRKKVDFRKQRDNNIDVVAYYAKNCFYFMVDEFATFGTKSGRLTFAPKSFHFGQWDYKNAKFRYDYILAHKEETGADAAFLEWALQSVQDAEKDMERTRELCKLSAYFEVPQA